MTGPPTYWTYTPDGEGRADVVSASSGTNPVTGTTYNGFSEPLSITFGSGDADAFTYDPNTGRMTQYKATVNSQSMSGTLTWNANGSLYTLAITDPFNSANAQTCTNTYDDLARLGINNCGAKWGQDFSYIDNATNSIGAFGNISKTIISGSTGTSFAAVYSDTTNRISTISGTAVTYDNNGNILSDGFHTYTWDADGKLATLDGNAETYDALGRRVEQLKSGAYTEIVYGPAGNKLALMSGQTVTKVFTPLPGGAAAVYTSGGLSYYRHPDWLGSSRLASTPTRTVYYDGAYAPFGEPYAGTGTADHNFTGQNQDMAPDLYDFLAREQHPTQGRWVSPDPAGINAVDPTNPQSWNRYTYVLNDPLNNIDPMGLDDDSPWPSCDDPTDPFPCWLPIGVFLGGGSGGGPGKSGSSGKGGARPQPGGAGFPNGETLGLPSGLSIPPLGLPGLLGLPGPGSDCNFGPCGGPLGNGYAAGTIAIGLGGEVICVGTGACEIVAAIAGVAAVGYGIYLGAKALTNVYASQRGNEQVKQSGAQVAREPGCRAPTPGDFEILHEAIRELKGRNGKVTYEQLLEEWREILCK
jgi:RHS repeat-associated protein